MTPYYSDDLVTIYHGDCREWMPEADVIVTDPPYGVRTRRDYPATTYRGVALVTGDLDTSLRDVVLASWSGPALVFGTWKAPRPSGVREVLAWDKVISTGMGDLSVPWRPSWEEIYVIGRPFTGARTHGVLRYGLPTLAPERHYHPTAKPVDLMAELIGKTMGIVLDPFMGSGSTLVAAKSLGRNAIGIEIEERYCEIAAQRCSQEVLGLVG